MLALLPQTWWFLFKKMVISSFVSSVLGKIFGMLILNANDAGEFSEHLRFLPEMWFYVDKEIIPYMCGLLPDIMAFFQKVLGRFNAIINVCYNI